MKKQKVIIGLSGGVDSAVAAALLLQEGYTVEALFMKNWEQDDTEGYCAAAEDLKDASQVAGLLDIPLHTVNFSKEYWDRVFRYFLDEYALCRTPNPDVLCNKEIKFNAFLDYALNLGADWIATGHYARVTHDTSSSQLFKAKDRNKDQTYFLHQVSREALKKTLFPLGNFIKSEVRAMAQNLHFPNHAKKDSTGICFIGEKRFKTFLNEYLLAVPGDIQATNGKVIGRHDGLMFYTLGQRQGLGIGGIEGNFSAPWYVVDKDIENNRLIVAEGDLHPMLYAHGLICGAIHWLEPEVTWPLVCTAKTRYRQDDQACIVADSDINQHTVWFSKPQRAITPGQYIVFYDQNKCLGGAIIEQIIR